MIWRIVRSRGFIPIVLILAALLYWKLSCGLAEGHFGRLRGRPRRHPLEHARASPRRSRRSALRRPRGSRARGRHGGAGARAIGHDWVDARFAANDGFRSVGKERLFIGARAHAARSGAGPDENPQQRARRTRPRRQANFSVRARNARVDFGTGRGGRSRGPEENSQEEKTSAADEQKSKQEDWLLVLRAIDSPANGDSTHASENVPAASEAMPRGDAVSGGPGLAQSVSGGGGRRGRACRRLGAGAIR